MVKKRAKIYSKSRHSFLKIQVQDKCNHDEHKKEKMQIVHRAIFFHNHKVLFGLFSFKKNKKIFFAFCGQENQQHEFYSLPRW